MLKFGYPPYLECSSRGDKRFSAFYAKIRNRNNKSIEQLYQAFKIFKDGTTSLSWRLAKGRKAINYKEASEFYSTLWDEYIEENPELLKVIDGYNGFSDIFGKIGSCCQAREIWRIKLNMHQVFPKEK